MADDRRMHCRFCGTDVAVAKNDTAKDHALPFPSQRERLCFGSGASEPPTTGDRR